MKRAIIMVLDSVGIGELPDAHKYHDEGSNTLRNIAKNIAGFELPNMESLGLGNIDGIQGVKKCSTPKGSFARMAEKSNGKDTTIGHWEIAGIEIKAPFPTYPNGFPKEIINSFEKAIGTKTLGNYPASGTEIIKQLGQQHIDTGYPIVYTSADSVFQIAAHEDIISVQRLYEMCKTARSILTGKHAVARVIARPFIGENENFKRTDRRHDFSLSPISKTILDYAKEKKLDVKAVGKINDIFNGCGITHFVHTHDNMDGIDKTINYLKEHFSGIIFTNLVDFDMRFGHRNDAAGYANALMEFDKRLPEILKNLHDEDILFITADHGCDPTTKSTDHSREYVPLLIYGKNLKSGINLGTRKTFADIAATIAEYLEIDVNFEANGFWRLVQAP